MVNEPEMKLANTEFNFSTRPLNGISDSSILISSENVKINWD